MEIMDTKPGEPFFSKQLPTPFSKFVFILFYFISKSKELGKLSQPKGNFVTPFFRNWNFQIRLGIFGYHKWSNITDYRKLKYYTKNIHIQKPCSMIDLNMLISGKSDGMELNPVKIPQVLLYVLFLLE